jgi:2-polyprenyl-6-methoxyphenol hydroxylase-like FAD-dependent oxidoreductase
MAGEAVLNNGATNGHSSPISNGHTHGSASKTGIRVIIVGAGFGGLCAAIECHRQGHEVEVYESFKELKVLGDIISFGANAGRIFRRWYVPGADGERISDRLDPLAIKRKTFDHLVSIDHLLTIV